MKIFNVQPITINEYIFNDEYIAESLPPTRYESHFNITGEEIDGLNTLFVTFNINYYVDHSVDEENIVTPISPNSWNIQTSFSIGEEEFISYKSSCQFNFESEGFDADVLSLTEFLTDYQAHTKSFFSQYGYKPLIPIEEETRMLLTLKADAEVAIENLRARNMYDF